MRAFSVVNRHLTGAWLFSRCDSQAWTCWLSCGIVAMRRSRHCRDAASGVYVYRLETREWAVNRRMLLLR